MIVLATALAAQAADAPSAPVASAGTPEPVLDLARRDVRAMRIARASQVAMIALPGAMVATAFVAANAKPGSAQVWAASAGVLASGVGLLVVSNVLHRHAIKSRHLLRAQGLDVPRTPAVVVPLLSTVGFLASATLAQRSITGAGASGWPAGAALLTAVGFGACFGIGSFQLELNRRARARATWISVVPVPIDRSSGLALVGTF